MDDFLEIFPWSDNLVTGIHEIDVQHKRLVHLLNKLASGLAYNIDTLDLNNIFNELSDYAVYHFQTEENLWHEFMTGDLWEVEHKKSHETFVTDLLDLKNDDNNKSVQEMLEKVLAFLIHWLAFHILCSDKRMSGVVLAVQSGRSLEDAKQHAQRKMSEGVEVMVETALAMYDSLSRHSIQWLTEITERKKAEQRANFLLQRNQVMMQSTPEGVHIMDDRGNLIEVNEAFCNHLGYTMEEVLRLSVFDFDAKMTSEDIWLGIENFQPGRHIRFESVHRRKDGSLVDVEVVSSCVQLDGIKRIFALSRDITERKQAEETIKNLAFYDTLTRMPNRRLLKDRLEQVMAASRRSGRYSALMFLDLDNFKPLNDAYGHGVGDLLLIEAARRISGCTRATDTVARFGGDEFVVMLSELDSDRTISTHQACIVAEKIRTSLAEIYRLPYIPITRPDENIEKIIEHRCTSSIGVVMFMNYEQYGADDIVRFADMAMYQAKDAGRNLIVFYDPMS